MYTIFDQETTGLVKAEGTDLLHQPYLIEIYAMQFDKNFNKVKEFESYIKPPKPLPAIITKITGITDADLADAPSFIEVYRDIIDVFFGSHTIIAHNLSFDEQVLIFELRRIGKEHHFPYPPIKYCTVEQSMWIKGHRLKNSELYEIATGKQMGEAHRARWDVKATFESHKWLKAQGG
jgi:DNA polymerase III epsilon subunit-like protein